jgi:two-component system, OmpR family, response regulator
MTVRTPHQQDSEDELQWRTVGRSFADHRRVLVVDDYADAADALQLLLIANGFECRAVHDAREVCTIAAAWQPFAVVLDIAMPELDGLELARRLRAAPDTTHMLLIACTGYASSLDRERARAAGFDAHSAKPLTPQRLLALLQKAVAAPDATAGGAA